MGRAPCCDKANVKKGPWSPEEDAKLKSYIDNHGTGGNWIALPHKIGLKRCGKSCRLRWLNYLRPNIKHGGFTEDEDNLICSLYVSIGSRWSVIAAQLPGRTDNDIKNYWNTRLKKKLLLASSKLPRPPPAQPSSSNNHLHFEPYFHDHQPMGPWAQQEQLAHSAAFDDMLFPAAAAAAGGFEVGFGEIPSSWPGETYTINHNTYSSGVVNDSSCDDDRKMMQDCSWIASLLMFDEPRLLGHSR